MQVLSPLFDYAMKTNRQATNVMFCFIFLETEKREVFVLIQANCIKYRLLKLIEKSWVC